MPKKLLTILNHKLKGKQMFELNFKPESDETIDEMIRREEEEKLFSPGEGRWQVMVSKGMTSQAGNPMFRVTFKGWDVNGKEGTVDDFFMVGDKPYFLKRLKSFCDSAGIPEVYSSGKMAESDIHNGLTGRCVFGTRSYKGKLQNSIEEYLKKLEGQKNLQNKELNDDIPW